MSIFAHIIKEHKNIIIECKNNAYDVFLDELNSTDWITRTKTNKSFDEILEILLSHKDSHWVFIERDNKHWEIGGSTMGKTPEYFMFLYLEYDVGLNLYMKYRSENNLRILSL